MKIENREKLEGKLEGFENVELAYVFGSRARGDETETSDLDLALYFSSAPSLQRISEVQRVLEQSVGLDVDVSVLNDSGIIFTHQVLRDGELLFCRDENLRVSFESEAYSRYLDYRHFFDSFNQARRQEVFS